MAKKRIKPKKNKSNKSIDKKLLDSWKNAVKERDDYTCQICNRNLKDSPPQSCQAHHIIPRDIKETRYEIDNGITLCCRCHGGSLIASPYSPHKNALWFANWLKVHKPEIYEKLMKILSELSP